LSGLKAALGEKRYRKRAKELRTIAAVMATEDARKLLLDVAAEYDEMAESARRLVQPKPKRPVGEP
jgi:hypothetical protein